MSDGLRYDTSPIGLGSNWVTKTDPVTGLGSFVRAVVHALIRDGHPESEAIEIALGVMKRWATGDSNHWHGANHVTPETQAKAAAAVAHWEALRLAAHAKSAAKGDGDRAVAEFGPTGPLNGPIGTDPSGSGNLLPRGPTGKVKPREAQIVGPKADEPHEFVGEGETCSVCGKSDDAQVHQLSRSLGRIAALLAGNRHAGPAGHVHVSTGHVKGNLMRLRTAEKAQMDSDIASLQPHFHMAMTDLFERQRTATIARLGGKRGRQMLNRSDPPDDQTPPGGITPPPPDIDPTAIFQPTFWANETAKVAQPIYDTAGEMGQARVQRQLAHMGQTEPVDERGSLGAVQSVLRARANKMAQDVTNTTFGQIKSTLADGLQKGESVPELTSRVQHVFDVARPRAEAIARTETIGSLNQTANAYAENLPPGIVGRKHWAAHHDTRTRTTHRIADGQNQPIGTPFHVGGSLMQFPGDPTAPPDEVINCRCVLLYLPPVATGLEIGSAA